MDEEAADELVGVEDHAAVARWPVSATVLAGEGDGAVLDGSDAAVRDGDAVGVAGKVGEHGLGSAEGRLGVNDPLLLAQWCEEGAERRWTGEVRMLTEELEASGFVGGEELLDEQSAEQTGEDTDGEEEVGLAVDPGRTAVLILALPGDFILYTGRCF